MFAAKIRYPVEPRDIPASKAARRLHLSLDEFRNKLPQLLKRGFPAPDPTTGMFFLPAIEAEAQGLPYVLVPRVLSSREWMERYGQQPAGEDSGVKTIQEPAATALLPNCP